MSPQTRRADPDEMRPEYDFSGGQRGVHHEAFRAGTNIVFLDPDLITAFPDSASVNEALRLLVRLSQSAAVTGHRRPKARQPTRRASGSRKAKRNPRAARG